MSDSLGAGSTRRSMLRLAGAAAFAGSAAAIAACGGSRSSSRTTTTLPQTPAQRVDVQLLNAVLDLEFRAIALYTAAVPLLSGSAHAAAKLFLEQELAHASQLTGLIGDSNGKADRQRASYDFGHPRGVHGLFSLLVALEDQQIAAYLNALPQLSTGPIRATIASILANDAQHLSVARLLLGRDPVPVGFVTGY